MTEDVARGAAAERGGEQSDSAEDSLSAVNRTETQLAQAGVVVARPVPGEVVHISAEAGETYVLDFDPGDARVLVDGDSLILVFEDGGQIIFENLVALGVIPGVFGEVQVTEPEPGQVIVITAEGGVRYVIAFDPSAAQVVVEGDNLVLVFANGGRIVFQGLGEFAGRPDAPIFEIAGTEVPGGTLMGQAITLAEGEAAPETPVTLETAAGGEGPQGTGATRYDDDLGDPIDLLDPQGVIPPVELAFGVPDLEPGPVFGGEPSLSASFRTVVPPQNGGISGSFVGGGFEDGEPNQHVGLAGDAFNSPTQILVTFTPANGTNQVLTSLTIFGIPSDATFFVGGTGSANQLNVSGGSITITAAELASGIFLLPGNNESDVDFPLTFTASFFNAVNGGTGQVSTTATFVMDAVADVPSLKTDPASGDQDTPIPLTITAGLNDPDGSESLNLSVGDIPVGATLSAGTNVFTATAASTSVDISAWDLSSLTITPPPGFAGTFVLTISATATETGLSGGELTTANNVSQVVSGEIEVFVDDKPEAENDAVTVDEDGLPAGNSDPTQDGDADVPDRDGDNNESTSEGTLVYDAGLNGFKSLTLDVTDDDPVLIKGTATQAE
jgi:hypothetical protein